MLPPPGFRDLQLIGSGATSHVYRAIDVRTGHAVALKRLHRQLADSPEALSRLKRELEALTKLRHTAIVPVRDVIRWQGAPAVVMDFVDGADVKELIRAHGALSPSSVEEIARALFGVLAAAHAAGIVHRDVKPQNVRIGRDGRIYLLDFGSARLEAASQLTKTGTTLGTPDYMAPELFAGTAYDPRVDIYGAGATLFECATGRIHQTADSLAELAYKRLHELPPSLAEISPELARHLAQVIDRSLAKEPDDRYATAELAIWALDHPREERAFALRRRTRPPCLHCAAPIAPESTVCSACGSKHPFSYAPGWSHLVLRAVRDPARLFIELASKLPERATPAHALALAERCAAVEHDKQRVISFIDAGEAEELARELEGAGAEVEVVHDRGTAETGGLALIVFATLALVGVIAWSALVASSRLLPPLILAALLIPLGLFGVYLPRVLAVLEARRGMLSPGAPSVFARAPLLFSIAAGAMFAAGLAAPLAGALLLDHRDLLPGVASWIGEQRGTCFTIAFAAAVAAWASTRFRLAHAPLSAAGSPEPSLIEQLKSALSRPSQPAQSVRSASATAIVVVAMVLVPAELALLAGIRAFDTPAIWLAVQKLTAGWRTPAPSPITYTSLSVVEDHELVIPESSIGLTPAQRERVRRRLIENEKIPDVLGLDRSVGADPRDLERPYSRESTFVSNHDLSDRPLIHLGWIDAVIGAALAAAIAALYLRRRRIRAAARELFAALAAIPRGRASPPRSRHPSWEPTSADRLARAAYADRFVAHARRRTVELSRFLGREDVERARRALSEVDRKSVASGAVGRAFLARCIVETDPELELRFGLLALEGEMEARAAEAWAASIGGAR